MKICTYLWLIVIDICFLLNVLWKLWWWTCRDISIKMLIGASLGALLVEHGNLRIFFPEFLGCSGPFQNTRTNTVTQLVTFFWSQSPSLSGWDFQCRISDFFPTRKHLPPDFGKFWKSIIFKNANREGDMSIARRTNSVKMIPFYFETVGIREVCKWSSRHDLLPLSWPRIPSMPFKTL